MIMMMMTTMAMATTTTTAADCYTANERKKQEMGLHNFE